MCIKLQVNFHHHSFKPPSKTRYLNSRVEDIGLNPDDIAVSVHACGRLTDTIIETVVNAGARLAVLPCCHDTKMDDLSGIGGWVEGKSP
jgi:hypothetical protein